MSHVSKQQKWILAATTLLATLAASVAMRGAETVRVTTVSPQGKVAQVRQVIVKFDEAMTPFGSPSAASPGGVTCSGAPAAATRGNARWIDQKTWAFDFENDLSPGVRCTFDLTKGIKSDADNIISGPSHSRPAARSLRA